MYCSVIVVCRCLCVISVVLFIARENSGLKSGISLHTGIYSFEELVLSDLFIDKTMMLKELLKSKCKVNLITRPRKWGKSVNIDMFKKFFEVEVNNIGIQLKIRERNNHLLFEGGKVDLGNGSRKTLRRLNIANSSSSMKRLGILPVIMLKISSVKGKNYRAVEENLKREMKNAYAQHGYLKEYLDKENKMLNMTEKAQLARYYSNKQLNIDELENGLLHLSKMLYSHFLRKVVILIDDYDAVLNHAVENFDDKSDETKQLMILLQNIYRRIINNIYLEKALLTGSLPFTEDALFINASKICVSSVLDERYSQSFGFSEAEVDDILNRTGLSNLTSIGKMKYWYKGYHHCGEMVYNPLDIMGFISNKGKLLDYWVDSGRIKSIDEYLITDEAQEDLLGLLEDEGTTKSLSKYDKTESEEEEKGFHIFFGIFYALMVHHGYLNAFRLGQPPSNYILRIPNQGIRNIFVEFRTKWFSTKHDILISDLHDFVGSLITSQMGELKGNLMRIFENFQNLTLQEENDYHNIMGDILNRLLNHNMIISNKHFEVGKLYHMLLPRSKYQGHTAFVLEYSVLKQPNKTVDLRRQLQSLAHKTLAEIDSNVYGPLLVHYRYINKVITSAFAFCERQLEVSYKVFKQNK